jgi:hypothetical protein
MAELGLLPALGLQITGGAGAAMLDRAKPDWTYHVGGAADPNSVAITPGAMGAAALALLLALSGGGTSKVKLALGNLAGGALVYEGVKLAEQQVIPRIEAYMSPTAAPQVPAGTAPATHGLPWGQRPLYPHEVAQTLRQYGRAA